jgi:hypothetical protein
MFRSALSVFLLIAGAISGARAEGTQEWFMQEDTDCSGLLGLQMFAATFTGSTVTLHEGSGVGKYYLSVPAAGLSAGIGVDRISNDRELDQSHAASLKAEYLKAADNLDVPVWVTKGASIITGEILTPTGAAVAGKIFEFFFNQIGAAKVTFRDAAMLIADGGHIYLRSNITKRADNNLLQVDNYEYRVALGNESRSIGMRGCIYPLQVIVSKFLTKADTNNKILKPIGANNWQVWDVTDNSPEGETWTYDHQAGGYYYFTSDALQDNVVVGKDQLRVSYIGGPWEEKDFGHDQDFVSLYEKVDAE